MYSSPFHPSFQVEFNLLWNMTFRLVTFQSLLTSALGCTRPLLVKLTLEYIPYWRHFHFTWCATVRRLCSRARVGGYSSTCPPNSCLFTVFDHQSCLVGAHWSSTFNGNRRLGIVGLFYGHWEACLFSTCVNPLAQKTVHSTVQMCEKSFISREGRCGFAVDWTASSWWSTFKNLKSISSSNSSPYSLIL
jgi:hypothetical protein